MSKILYACVFGLLFNILAAGNILFAPFSYYLRKKAAKIRRFFSTKFTHRLIVKAEVGTLCIRNSYLTKYELL